MIIFEGDLTSQADVLRLRQATGLPLLPAQLWHVKHVRSIPCAASV